MGGGGGGCRTSCRTIFSFGFFGEDEKKARIPLEEDC